ncbi:unnamed protein product [Schistosoma curassoni]|uniref:Transmembrane protein n=1 Tax=Schistosoma curassoni TaxID=6186 RepID=A0A183KCW5_9TREM|nr:unnamed protein product [Schistosoma curassoni]
MSLKPPQIQLLVQVPQEGISVHDELLYKLKNNYTQSGDKRERISDVVNNDNNNNVNRLTVSQSKNCIFRITGSLYCFNRGFKRMLIAGMIASVPGLLTGVLSMLACRASNSTFEELYAKYLNETQKI